MPSRLCIELFLLYGGGSTCASSEVPIHATKLIGRGSWEDQGAVPRRNNKEHASNAPKKKEEGDGGNGTTHCQTKSEATRYRKRETPKRIKSENEVGRESLGERRCWRRTRNEESCSSSISIRSTVRSVRRWSWNLPLDSEGAPISQCHRFIAH